MSVGQSGKREKPYSLSELGTMYQNKNKIPKNRKPYPFADPRLVGAEGFNIIPINTVNNITPYYAPLMKLKYSLEQVSEGVSGEDAIIDLKRYVQNQFKDLSTDHPMEELYDQYVLDTFSVQRQLPGVGKPEWGQIQKKNISFISVKNIPKGEDLVKLYITLGQVKKYADLKDPNQFNRLHVSVTEALGGKTKAELAANALVEEQGRAAEAQAAKEARAEAQRKTIVDRNTKNFERSISSVSKGGKVDSTEIQGYIRVQFTSKFGEKMLPVYLSKLKERIEENGGSVSDEDNAKVELIEGVYQACFLEEAAKFLAGFDPMAVNIPREQNPDELDEFLDLGDEAAEEEFDPYYIKFKNLSAFAKAYPGKLPADMKRQFDEARKTVDARRQVGAYEHNSLMMGYVDVMLKQSIEEQIESQLPVIGQIFQKGQTVKVYKEAASRTNTFVKETAQQILGDEKISQQEKAKHFLNLANLISMSFLFSGSENKLKEAAKTEEFEHAMANVKTLRSYIQATDPLLLQEVDELPGMLEMQNASKGKEVIPDRGRSPSEIATMQKKQAKAAAATRKAEQEQEKALQKQNHSNAVQLVAEAGMMLLGFSAVGGFGEGRYETTDMPIGETLKIIKIMQREVTGGRFQPQQVDFIYPTIGGEQRVLFDGVGHEADGFGGIQVALVDVLNNRGGAQKFRKQFGAMPLYIQKMVRNKYKKEIKELDPKLAEDIFPGNDLSELTVADLTNSRRGGKAIITAIDKAKEAAVAERLALDQAKVDEIFAEVAVRLTDYNQSDQTLMRNKPKYFKPEGTQKTYKEAPFNFFVIDDEGNKIEHDTSNTIGAVFTNNFEGGENREALLEHFKGKKFQTKGFKGFKDIVEKAPAWIKLELRIYAREQMGDVSNPDQYLDKVFGQEAVLQEEIAKENTLEQYGDKLAAMEKVAGNRKMKKGTLYEHINEGGKGTGDYYFVSDDSKNKEKAPEIRFVLADEEKMSADASKDLITAIQEIRAKIDSAQKLEKDSPGAIAAEQWEKALKRIRGKKLNTLIGIVFKKSAGKNRARDRVFRLVEALGLDPNEKADKAAFGSIVKAAREGARKWTGFTYSRNKAYPDIFSKKKGRGHIFDDLQRYQAEMDRIKREAGKGGKKAKKLKEKLLARSPSFKQEVGIGGAKGKSGTVKGK